MQFIDKLNKILQHPFVDTVAKVIKKFKSSKSYWSVVFVVILFILREGVAWKYGSAIGAYAQKQLEGSDLTWLWSFIEFVFDFGGSWELALGGLFIFIILSLVKVSEGEHNTITLKESFLSLLLLSILIGMGIYALTSNNTDHAKTHNEQQITQNKLDELKALIKLQGGDEIPFLEKYFGKDYSVILHNPQTYHNFTTLLKQTKKTADELLKEREELLKKIASQKFNDSLQNQIDKAFKALRYEDVAELMDGFLEANSDKEKEIIKAHYIKALSYIEQIRYQDAREEFEKIGPNIDDDKILFDYAKIYYILGEYDKALEHYKKSLKIRLATLGENHPSAATSYHNIGSVWMQKGEHDKAIEYYDKSLKIALATLGENHPSTASSYHNIGVVWMHKGVYDKTIEYYGKSLKIALATLGKNHPSTATNYDNIGSVWMHKGEYDKTLEYYEKSLKIRLATLGENHPSTATSYHNIGSVWMHKGEYDKTLEYYEKSLKIRLATLGENHPSTATSYDNIGSVWEGKGEYDKALEFYEKSLKIRLATLGENHPCTATIYANIGAVWEGKGEYDKALEYYEKSLKIRLATLGKNHPSTATSYNNIGVVWGHKGEYDKAIEYFKKSLGILKNVFPNGHPYIDITTKNFNSAIENSK